ncbi:HAD family hydrolase [Chitiniphilus purpureus]|uniref:D,D-heptose 1,7-bisphosphate phosphatase n=1 Tax=Chitiniphilus purpureus TaxID=2981137 RepID=A0ABY6DS55_9NEIS|nr:HAD family hydrolase [Chitiniphilus sp. CD1]UXY16301.1 HAD family hydrolase [Chitiniphilus sp. CD1]
MSQAAVFLDKDGTLVHDVPYNIDPELIELTDNAGPALLLLLEHGFKLFVISNQPGIGLGYFPAAALGPVSRRVLDLVQEEGALLHGFYYCPHAPAEPGQKGCDCRKPAPGLLLQAAEQHDIDLERSWFIGDILDDIEAGHRAGCRSILIDNGNETEWRASSLRKPEYLARDLLDAASHIVMQQLLAHTPLERAR